MANALAFLNRVRIAPAMAVMFAGAAGLLVAWTPQPLFEHAVASSGMAAVFSIAKAPLGLKARLLAICLAAAAAALVALLVGIVIERAIDAPKRQKSNRVDDEFDLAPYASPERAVHPRAPIFADRELGAPLMSDEALAAAAPLVSEAPILPDGAVIEPTPIVRLADIPPALDREPDLPALDAPLAFEEFDVPPSQQSFQPIAGETSIEALIRRLEAGIARRDMPRPPTPAAPVAPTAPSFNERTGLRAVPNTPFDPEATRALDALRQMAAR